MEKGSDFRSTDRTRIILHPYNLTTALTQTQMSAWEHNRVLSNTEANYAFIMLVVDWVNREGLLIQEEDGAISVVLQVIKQAATKLQAKIGC